MKRNIAIPQPWRLTIEEFKATGPFKDWEDVRVMEAIATLEQLCLIASEIRLTDKRPTKPCNR
jgi:hypothetical protein